MRGVSNGLNCLSECEMISTTITSTINSRQVSDMKSITTTTSNTTTSNAGSRKRYYYERQAKKGKYITL